MKKPSTEKRIALGIFITVVVSLMYHMSYDARLNSKFIIHQLYHNRDTFLNAIANGETNIGIVELAKRYSLTPYGFSKPTIWTMDLPLNTFQKNDAMPVNIIENLLLHDFYGRRLGTSLFISSVRTNDKKEKYLQGVKNEYIDFYMSKIKHALDKPPVDQYVHRQALYINSYLTWIVHFGDEPSEHGIKTIMSMCDMMSRQLNGTYIQSAFEPYVLNKLGFYKYLKTREYKDPCCFNAWAAAGYSFDDMFAEFAHNVFGMTIQWTYVLYRMMVENVRTHDISDAANYLLSDPPAGVATSRSKDGSTLVVHDLHNICRRAKKVEFVNTPICQSKCPFFKPKWTTAKSETGCIVLSNQPLYESDPNYAVFGSGERRCPGEYLTYRFMVEVSKHLKPYDITLTGGSEFIGVRNIKLYKFTTNDM